MCVLLRVVVVVVVVEEKQTKLQARPRDLRASRTIVAAADFPNRHLGYCAGVRRLQTVVVLSRGCRAATTRARGCVPRTLYTYNELHSTRIFSSCKYHLYLRSRIFSGYTRDTARARQHCTDEVGVSSCMCTSRVFICIFIVELLPVCT